MVGEQKGRLDGRQGKNGDDDRDRARTNMTIAPVAPTSTARHPARLLPSHKPPLRIPQRASKAHQKPIRHGGHGGHGEGAQGCLDHFCKMAGAQPLKWWLVLVWKRDL